MEGMQAIISSIGRCVLRRDLTHRHLRQHRMHEARDVDDLHRDEVRTTEGI